MNINAAVSKLIGNNKKIGVAVSGGVDSMVLLTLLCDYALQNKDLTISVINIEHGIRGDDSVRDSNFVADFCNKKVLKLYFKAVNAPQIAKNEKMTLEEAARYARYEFFSQLLESRELDLVATAHHLGDQTETLLMRIARGVGIKGLVGIKASTGGYIRPLLSLSKEEILQFADERGVSYVTDKTNYDTRYTRNFFRNEIIPFLCSEGGTLSEILENADTKNSIANTQIFNLGEIEGTENIIEKTQPFDLVKTADTENTLTNIQPFNLAKCMQNISAAAEKLYFLAEKAAKTVPFDGETAYIDIGVLALGDLYAKVALDRAFAHFGVEKDVEARHLFQIKTLAAKENGTRINMPFNLTAYKEYDYITLTRKSQRIKSAVIEKTKLLELFNTEDNINLFGSSAAIFQTQDKINIISSYATQIIGKEEIKTVLERIILREKTETKKLADGSLYEKIENNDFSCAQNPILNTKITVKELLFDAEKLPQKITLRARRTGDLFRNVGGKEKLLSDFLQEKRLPQRLRDSLILVADGKRILIINGVAVSDELKTDEKSTSAILLKYSLQK